MREAISWERRRLESNRAIKPLLQPTETTIITESRASLASTGIVQATGQTLAFQELNYLHRHEASCQPKKSLYPTMRMTA